MVYWFSYNTSGGVIYFLITLCARTRFPSTIFSCKLRLILDSILVPLGEGVTTAIIMPSKAPSDAISLWGNILCEQLAVLDWQRAQREKYPFYKELISPSIFVQPNPLAFQNLMHFLFNVLDSAEAGEKFLGLWPLHPGDKKAASQFRLKPRCQT